MKRAIVTAMMLAAVVPAAFAEVARVEVVRREPFAGGMNFGAAGPYEKIAGRLHYRIDPRNAANARIVDLQFAPRDADGMVTFAGDFILLKPVDLAKGNHRILYDVNNRGGLAMVPRFNLAVGSNDPSGPEHAGNGFLMRQGYTLLWSAWNWDVTPGGGRLQIELPVATDHGKAITGRVVSEIVVNERSTSEPLAWGNSRTYPVADPAAADAALTVRDEQRGERRAIPRASWRFARAEAGAAVPDPTYLWLDGGFEPGRIYELVYTAKDPRIVGLGLAAIRDAIAFFRFAERDAAGQANPMAVQAGGGQLRPDPAKAYIFGISQSGRVIQHMIWQGFHVDERQRLVFEAAMPHVPGGGKGSFNHRFAQTTRHPSEFEDHQYPADFFPFVPGTQTDPVTGTTGDVLAVAKSLGQVPLVMYTGTSTEYWTRAASLVHTDALGRTDAALDPHVRVYVIAGGQHQNTRTSRRTVYAHLGNPLDQSAPLRALLVALDRWATNGTLPPASRYPRIDRGELVPVEVHRQRFPAIPGARHPGTLLQPPRLDFGPRFWTEGVADVQPPRFGDAYVTLVPNVDADGNEMGGIRTPDVAVPLGTYTGWNPRGEAIGAPGHLARWAGSFMPFAPTEAARAASGDPRPSIEARYANKAEYVKQIRAVAEALARERLLLREDADDFVQRAERGAWPPPVPGAAHTPPRPAAGAPAAARQPAASLTGIAALPPDTFRAGPPSGGFRDNGVRGTAFPSQPVQGTSAMQPDPARPGSWLVLSDNGYGVRWNSADYLLSLYRLRPDWKSAAGGSGTIEVDEVTRLSDPDRHVAFRLVRDDTPERWLTGGDFDPESFVLAADGTFWIGDEFGPFLLHVGPTGSLLAPPYGVPGLKTPDTPGTAPPEAGAPNDANVRRSRGFEGLAREADGARLLAMLEGPAVADPQDEARILEFDPAAGAYTGRVWRYRFEAPGHSATELVGYAPDRYLVIERDNLHGPAARFKRVFAIRLRQPGEPVEKTEVVDLLNVADPDRLGGPGGVFTFPFITTEAVWPLDATTLVLANDNNYPGTGGRVAGQRDPTEFIRLRLAVPLPR